MGQTRKDMKKIKDQCRLCGEFQNHACNLGYNVYCYRQSKKKCIDYHPPSVIQAAKELANAAGIDLQKNSSENAVLTIF